MTELKYTTPTVGEKNTVAEPLVDTALNKIKEFINGKELDGTTNFKAAGIIEANLSTALQEKIGTKTGLTVTKQNASYEAANGDLVIEEKLAATVTLPAATANRQIAIFCTPGSCKVKASAGKIFGLGLTATGVTELELAQNQCIIVEANGSDWLILAGESKSAELYEIKTYTKAEAEASVEPSKTRSALLTFSAVGGLEVGGINLAGPPAVVFPGSTVKVNPGQKWKATEALKVGQILV